MIKFGSILLLLFFFLGSFMLNSLHSQTVDFENFDQLSPGDPIGTISVNDIRFRIFKSYNLKDSTSLTLQKVGFEARSGGYYGPEYSFDCNGNPTPTIRKNQVNDSLYALNPAFTNRERIGCYFISCDLEGRTLPSVFIQYEKPIRQCSADLLDVDGHENTIEAYDIYLYADLKDYPNNPISTKPIAVRSKGKTYGPGLIGDNGGVLPLKIEADSPFMLIEFRPIQQITPQNDVRYDFGFAFDNFSPSRIEKAPYTPPYLVEGNHDQIRHVPPTKKNTRPFVSRQEDIYFDFDQFSLTTASVAILRDIMDDIRHYQKPESNIEFTLILSGYTDPSGSDLYNKYLSKKRVMAAKNYFLKQGVKAAFIEVAYFGEQYHRDVNDPDWKKRTVHIELKYRKK